VLGFTPTQRVRSPRKGITDTDVLLAELAEQDRRPVADEDELHAVVGDRGDGLSDGSRSRDDRGEPLVVAACIGERHLDPPRSDEGLATPCRGIRRRRRRVRCSDSYPLRQGSWSAAGFGGTDRDLHDPPGSRSCTDGFTAVSRRGGDRGRRRLVHQCVHGERGQCGQNCMCSPHETASSGLHEASDGLGGFLDFLVGFGAAGLGGPDDAVLKVVVQEGEGDVLQSGGDGADLGEDVDAVGVLIDHAVDATGLSLDALESGEVAVFVTDVSMAGFGWWRGDGVHRAFSWFKWCPLRRQMDAHSDGAWSRILAVLAAGVRSRRRSSWALSATTTVETDIRIAPILIGNTNPIGASTPAARGTEIRL